MVQTRPPSHAHLVIIGGGIVGCSAAYHLAKLGWRDVVVIDKGKLPYNDGSTSHAPGSMYLTNFSHMMTRFAVQSRQIYRELPEFEAGRPPFRPTGGLEVAYTKERMQDLKRKHGVATSYGVESYLLTPGETAQHIPILDPAVIVGSFYVPGDASVIAWHIAGSLAREAGRIGGVRCIQDTRVTDLEVDRGRIGAIVTDRGTIRCEQALLCANIWAPVIGEKLGLRIPLLAAQHQYTITEGLPELSEYAQERGGDEIVHPILRHQDFSMYFRQHWDAYGIGNYRHAPLMVDPYRLGKTAIKPFTPKHFGTAWQAARELLPPVNNVDLIEKFNGMFAFTVDGFPVIGESAVKGFWTAVGVWITHAGGVGKAIAELMTAGEAEIDIHEADINRFLPFQQTRRYVELRSAQNYREVYDIIHPAQPIDRPRKVRLSPYHARLTDQHGHFIPAAGYELAQWYVANERLLASYAAQIPQRTGWEAQFWSPIQGAEHLEVRANVGLFNVSTLAVIEVDGPGATGLLERVAANRIERPIGKIVYTSLLTPKGGIASDLTIVRLDQDRYWVVTGGALLTRDLAWLRRHAPDDGSVTITDRSSRYMPIGLWGPNARRVLQKATGHDVSNEAFPYYTARSIEIGCAPVVALRISYVGELGWELYPPAEYALSVWDDLWDAGREFGMIAAGAGAFDSLRLEKGYRLWGQDIHQDYNPFEAGTGWAVRLDRGEFVGRAALLKAKAGGQARLLCCLTFDTAAGMALGKEPIFDGDHCIGYVTSANMGYSVGKHIAYGYLPAESSAPGRQLEIEYFGERHPVTVAVEPLFDPTNQRLKG